MKPNLAEVIFPNDSLPFVIDKALVQCLAHIPLSHTGPVRKSSNHIWAKARARQAVQSKRNLTQPPPDWKEECITNWLNQIGTALANIYAEDNGGPICAYYDTWGNQTVPQERSHAQKHQTLNSSNIEHKLDLILLDQPSLRNRMWQKVHALCKVTCSLRAKNRTLKDTVLQKLYITLTSQANWCFIPCQNIAHDSFKPLVVDHAGLITSAEMNLK